MGIETAWRGAFTNPEVNLLHAEGSRTRVYDESEWDWEPLVLAHSLGRVTARSDGELAGKPMAHGRNGRRLDRVVAT
ncbi:MAG: hypothetical protein M3Y77_19485 [Actinomycetota bacterium]|nr:hypothetical protein [Actinomycetota bacterium]